MSNTILLSFWLIQIHMTAIWYSTAWRNVPEKNGQVLQGLPNVFGIADDILIAGSNEMDRDHCATLDKVPRM